MPPRVQRLTRPSASNADPIEVLINHLKSAERDGADHVRANVERECDDLLPQYHKNLDALARLLTYDETCVAVCCIDKQLVIASNRQSPEYAKAYLPLLKAYRANPFLQNYNELLNKAHDAIRLWYNKEMSGNKELRGIQNAQSHNNQLCLDLYDALRNFDFQRICDVGHIAISSGDIYAKELAIKSLMPIIDTRIITRALEQKTGLEDEVIIAISNGNTQLVEEILVPALLNRSFKHAEMKIAEILWGKSGNYYIGITKLTCWPCNVSVIVFNEENGCQITVRGTHGGTYDWHPPQWIVDNVGVSKKFQSILMENVGEHPKLHEYEYYAENFLPLEPVLAKFNTLEEAKAQLAINLQPVTELQGKLANLRSAYDKFILQYKEDIAAYARKRNCSVDQLNEEEQNKIVKQKIRDELSEIHRSISNTKSECSKTTKDKTALESRGFDGMLLRLQNIKDSTSTNLDDKYTKIQGAISLYEDKSWHIFKQELYGNKKPSGSLTKAQIIESVIEYYENRCEKSRSLLQKYGSKVDTCKEDIVKFSEDLKRLESTQDRFSKLLQCQRETLLELENLVRNHEHTELQHAITIHEDVVLAAVVAEPNEHA